MKQLMSVLLLMMSIAAHSQSGDDGTVTKEFGISVDAMNCNTDIGGSAVDVQSFKPGAGLYFEMSYLERFGFRLEGTTGAVTASDTRAFDYFKRGRNLSFTSNIKEISLLAEVHPFNFNSDQYNQAPLSFYFLAGAGYFNFNPRTQYNGRWVYLQPLHTEGEGFPETGRPNYQLHSINFAFGGGLQYNLSDRLILRGEAVYRFLRTDYLDDVSTTYIDPNLFDKRLSPTNAALARRLADRTYELVQNAVEPPGAIRGGSKKDAYYSINIKLGIRLIKGSGSLYSSFPKKRNGCPVFKML